MPNLIQEVLILFGVLLHPIEAPIYSPGGKEIRIAPVHHVFRVTLSFSPFIMTRKTPVTAQCGP